MRSIIRAVGNPLLLTTFLLALVITQIAVAKATLGPTMRVEPYASTAQVGESFTINITLNDVQDLYGVEVTLHWNASILKVVDVDIQLGVESHSDGVLHEPIFIAKNETRQEEGKYLLAGTSTAPAASFNGSGNIVRLTFNVTNFGSCKLDLGTELRGIPPLGGIAPLIGHTTTNGFFGRQIKISAFPLMITAGENVSVSGFIIPAQANVEVTILYRREGETDWRTLTTVITNEQGNYQYTWRPQEKGEYEVGATAIIEATEETSSSVFVTVEALGQPTWPYITIIIVVIIIVVITAIVMYRKRIKKLKKKPERTA